MKGTAMKSWWSGNWGKVLGGFLALIPIGLITFWIYIANWWAFVDNYEVGYRFNARTGEITLLEHSGWIPKEPFFEMVGAVDTRPMQVCINANQRVLNCKLVRFNPEGLRLFLEWHGRDWASTSTLEEILKSYAYDGSGRDYPFLTIVRELRPQDVDVEGLDSVAPQTIEESAPTQTSDQ